MRDDVRDALEEFLVEHVMIGLGNIRGSIARIEGMGPQAAAQRQLALDRIGAQIDHIEARARSLQAMLGRIEPVAAPPFSRPQASEAPVLFQSRRRMI